jgi:hypothetical protein
MPALTAREELATAYIHLCACLVAAETEDYQAGREPMVPLGAVKRAVLDLEPYSVVPTLDTLNRWRATP